jgi:hypothetical protein
VARWQSPGAWVTAYFEKDKVTEPQHEFVLDMIAEIDAKILTLKRWINHLTEWRKTFCDLLAALPARAADRTREEQEQGLGLKLSIANIDRGCEYWNAPP